MIEDCRYRGHDQVKWGIAVLILGIFTVVLYLLVRNDTKIPKSEREEPIDSETVVVLYCWGLVVLAFLLLILSPSSV